MSPNFHSRKKEIIEGYTSNHDFHSCILFIIQKSVIIAYWSFSKINPIDAYCLQAERVQKTTGSNVDLYRGREAWRGLLVRGGVGKTSRKTWPSVQSLRLSRWKGRENTPNQSSTLTCLPANNCTCLPDAKTWTIYCILLLYLNYFFKASYEVF